jgi:hypothetical protein
MCTCVCICVCADIAGLRADYLTGDLGLDPFNVKADPKAFNDLRYVCVCFVCVGVCVPGESVRVWCECVE